MYIIIIIVLTNLAMHGLFRPLEKYAGPYILIAGSYVSPSFWGFMSEFSSESACLLVVIRDISVKYTYTG
jgi:hypothetical protein